jgi:hypothetical protein
MPAAYSKRFGVSVGSLSNYIVPPNKRAIVKCCTAYNSNAAAAAAWLTVASYLVLNVNIPAGAGAERAGLMIVAEAGEELKFAANAGVTAQWSGYLLDVTP